MEEKNYDFYQKLRSRTREWLRSEDGSSSKWAEYLMFAPDLFHLLCKLAMDSEVPVRERVKLAAAMAYFVSPFDLLPEALICFIGFADDIALAAYVLNSLVNHCDPEILRRHWAGDEDILVLVQKILKFGNRMSKAGVLGKGVWKKMKGMFK
ncbi:MAG: YkvA family protein [Desulfobacterales bacterium]|nr:YkvA family protein [Desulfobacterales bacterium]